MEQSQLTIMAYLNDEFTGGNTNFLDQSSKPHPITHALKPATGLLITFLIAFHPFNDILLGMVLIFEHDMFHEGEALISGKKYIMRR